MDAYVAGVFSGLYNTPNGRKIWVFLNRDKNIVRMETATALGRPAVEGIEEPLLQEFGEDVTQKRAKQMIGHMVRQIMERRGYVIAAQNVKITNGGPFSSATRYKRPGDMTYHVFRTSKDRSIFALTADKAGTNLPKDQPAPGTRWTYWKSFRGGLRGRIVFGLEDEAEAHVAVVENGFHIYPSKRILRAAK